MGGWGLTRTNALPYVDTFSFRVPYTALGVEWPVEVELPYAGGVCDEAGHGGGRGVRRGVERVGASGAWAVEEERGEGGDGAASGR